MIFANAGSADGKRKVFIMGITETNLEKLRAGHPLIITREKHGEGVPEGYEFVIYWAQDEQALFQSIKPFLGPGTEVKIDPRLHSDP